MSADAEDPFDYIIVGAGSAGCVLANRLSADPARRVLLIEAGPADRHPLIHFPRGLARLMADPRHCWQTPATVSDRNEPEIWLRGRMLGGSSSINGMIYVRAQPEDYADWEALGCTGWGWDTMREAYRAIEDHELGADEVRGAGGPLHVSIMREHNPVSDAVIAAGAALGLPARADINRPDQIGIGYSTRTIRNGLRVSSAKAFLTPIRKRPNLTVVTDTLTERVVFEGGRAVAVECVRDGKPVRHACRGEVIVAAGSLQSPALLQRSGIGAGDLLRAHGIPVVVDRPAVGRNLREHRSLPMQFRLRGNIGYNRQLRGPGLALSALRYLLGRKGAFAQAAFDVCGFFSTDGSGRADAQILAVPLTLDQSQRLPVIEREGGLLIIGYPARPTSTGSVAITGPSAHAPLDIRASFLATAHDRRIMGRIAAFVRELCAQEPLAGLISHETHPGTDLRSDEDVARAAAAAGYCGYHAVGTCAMGGADTAVLDPSLRVRGVTGLRVVDTSAMPLMVSGNTNAPVMAMAWRAADLILADRRAGAR